MTRGRLVFVLVSLTFVMTVVGGSLLAAVGRDKDSGDDSLYKYLSVFTETFHLVREAYVDDTSVDTLLGAALDGTTDALDPFCVYVPAKAVAIHEAAHAIGRSRSGLLTLKERGIAYIVGVDEGSPAAAAGIQEGDLLSKIDNRSTRLMPTWDLERQFAEAPGTKLELEVIRRGAPVKTTIELKSFSPLAPRVEPERDGANVLRIASFDSGTAAATATLLRQLQSAGHAKLLIDLRGVAAPDVRLAYPVAALFARGESGALLSRDKTLETFSSTSQPLWNGEVVVLVDHGTLGAAEILATVLRQKIGAKLVGEETFGWASHLASMKLRSGAHLELTDGFYTGPDHVLLKSGLVPDLEVTERSRTFAEKDKPLPAIVRDRALRLLLGEDSLPAKKAA